MRTRTALLTGWLLFASAGVFAQTRSSTTITPITTTTTSATAGQTITLSGTAYKVSTVKVLATGVEYYAAKATTSGAVTTNFLRTNNTYNATVFSQSQYETFIKTGRMSTFGTVKKYATPSGSTGYYVAVGTTKAYLVADGKDLFINEVITSRELTPEEQITVRNCKDACDVAALECRRQGNEDVAEGEGDRYLRTCTPTLEACTNKCYTDVLTKIRLSYHALSAAVTVNPK